MLSSTSGCLFWYCMKGVLACFVFISRRCSKTFVLCDTSCPIQLRSSWCLSQSGQCVRQKTDLTSLTTWRVLRVMAGYCQSSYIPILSTCCHVTPFDQYLEDRKCKSQTPVRDFPCDFAIMRECDAIGDAKKCSSKRKRMPWTTLQRLHCGMNCHAISLTHYRKKFRNLNFFAIIWYRDFAISHEKIA